ncbi:hydroxyethylthiazole kinase, sugar kinase family [Desulfosporosinus orientis DSM 765]|uniref:Hydroxyethylthiazole kinase n=1 Tax=Desulfosporosinus orientis (strain ATCC 19365 / DSM 765 / NCIMB 8382 / VKM B-1628 / Singapore I) TaxID=768706 RepID=G7WDE6_DESOD|nr:hydroxyethylthiazole kinase [Desulfosporosinus orientis]AET67915.1 hydroxyethylthiazole kinase, sugar kinase family [Desulfosporosinus orientis DSM 765]
MVNKEEIQNQIIQAVETVRRTNPLAGSITNTVTMNFVANAQLAVGGSAAMVYLPDEGEFLAKAGGATYINMGTLLPVYEETLPHTAKVLYDTGKPWILDPVAIGIGTLRTQLLRQFKDYKPSVVRGNASEIIALAGLWGLDGGTDVSNVRGVDSTDSVNAAKAAAVALAKWTGGAVAVSGETDLITDGNLIVFSQGGSHFMEKITGFGCSLGGVAAVYAAAASPFIAALTSTAVYNLAGNRAENKADAPGSFQVQFLDELYKATAEDIADNPLEIEEV